MRTKYNTLALKYGTTSVTNETGMDLDRIDYYSEQIRRALKEKVAKNILLTTSGSVAVGTLRWRKLRGDAPLPSAQTLAGMGSAGAHIAWLDALEDKGLPAEQVLLTHREIDDAKTKPFLDAAITDAFMHGVVVIQNENDVTSVDELARLAYGGENDGLAGHTAISSRADALIIYTDVAGILHKSGRLMDRIPYTDVAHAMARRAVASAEEIASQNPKNGPLRKVNACIEVAGAAIPAHVAHAGTDFEAVLSGDVGSYFVAKAFSSVE